MCAAVNFSRAVTLPDNDIQNPVVCTVNSSYQVERDFEIIKVK